MPPEAVITEDTGAENTETVEVDIFSSQGITGPTEAELRGEDTAETKTEEKAEPEKETSEESTETETKTETETETKDTKPDDKAESTEEDPANSEPVKEDAKVPKGYVPLAAVHEARGEIRYLKEQIQSLQSQMTQQPKAEEMTAKELDDFEVLSDEDFEDLAEDNPAQAAIYLRKLNTYEAKQRAKEAEEKQQAEYSERFEEIIDTAVAEIEKVAPGIYDEDSEVQKELLEFADSFGFTEDMYYLTNPATQIILPGEAEPLLLGEQAASILGMLVNAKSKMQAPDTSELEAKLEAKLREEITAELMKKFKSPETESYRGLKDVPKSDTEVPAESLSGKVLTTEELSKLAETNPAEYERYLAGN